MLTVLPSTLGQLKNLTTLKLNSNRLTVLPPEIGNLLSLRHFDLGVNQLTELPGELFQLTKLNTLNLNVNQLTEVPPEIGHLTSLQHLGLGLNRLPKVPGEIGDLVNLQQLSLGRNQLTIIPSEIGKLTNLKDLDLVRNKLISLPPQLADLLSKGLLLELENNPLQDPLYELFERGPRALATYLKSLDDGVSQYEAKLLLVGEGNVGKTSLVAALHKEPFRESRPTTHGIEIQPLVMRHPVMSSNMTLRAWDFGGQEVYRITHQFFFTQRALYLVVWKPREGQEQNDVEGWVRRIRLRVNRNARILIVATHCEERRPELDYPYLEQTFPRLLVGHYEVDNCTGRGIAALQESIAGEAAQLPQMGQVISLRWISARDDILSHAGTEPQISFELFTELCQNHQVYGDEIITLAKLMHDLGHIIYYADDDGLRDIVILDPEWITRAISYVLEDEPARDSGGILDHARLIDIWRGRYEDGYPTYHYPYFLRLMEKFDVSYRLQDDEYRSLVAQLVPHRRPELPWDTNTPPPYGIRRLALVCKLSEPVPGIVAWLTVRHHRSSTGKHWRSGVFLRYPISDYASEALLELQAPDRLVLDVRAPSPDLFFNVLRDSIEDLITHRWPGLEYALFVPCPTRLANGIACRGQFPLQFLLRYREQDATRAPCHECLADHDLSTLLTGFTYSAQPFQEMLEQLHDEIAEVGTGVSRVEDGIERLQGHAATTADSIRRILRIVGTEITDCPRLFTITQADPTRLKRLKFYQRHYRLVLWCEHPGYWHPWAPATYYLDTPRDWLVQIAPYASLIVKALRLVAPFVAAGADMLLDEKTFSRLQHELELMSTVLEELPAETSEFGSQVSVLTTLSQLSPAEDQAARALRILLFDHDHGRAFGDMRRVQSPSGDLLWVCANHYSEYDPGLPLIPSQKSP